MMVTLLLVILRGMGSLKGHIDPETNAVVSSVQACALGSVAAGSLGAGSADPGMIFFIALAVISTSRVNARKSRDATIRTIQLGQPEPLAYRPATH